MNVPLQIAIDGPAASGKTTVARQLAERLQIAYLDTGAMYRALAYLALHTRTDADSESALVRLFHEQAIHVAFDAVNAAHSKMGFHVFASGHELESEDLQSNEVTAIVSTIAKHPHVREAMVVEQRRIADHAPVVMAGRDIGTVVLPNAPVKIFLTASVLARVERRRAQLQLAGVDISVHRLAEEIEERDRLDRSRAVSPLVPAPDAHIVDSSEKPVDAVLDEIFAIIGAQ